MASPDGGDAPLLRVMALHALAYCERLFYLEEVEEIRVADDRVFAGRALHEELAAAEGEERRTFEIQDETLGLTGKLDAVRHREGGWVPIEHKRGRPYRLPDKTAAAWPSDEIQVSAYGMLLEKATGQPVAEGRIRYHAENVTVRVPLDDSRRGKVRQAIKRAGELRRSTERPPITASENRCLHCSLAPVCLPEEERLAADADWAPVRLFPPYPEGQTIHVTSHRAHVGRSGDTLVVETEEKKESFPIREVAALAIHSHAQVTTQAIHLCAAEGIAIHWFTGGGQHAAALSSGAGAVQRRLRQYQALTDASACLMLARRLALARMEGQLRYLLRATRGESARPVEVENAKSNIHNAMAGAAKAENIDSLRGYEGTAGRTYFGALPCLLGAQVPAEMRPDGRSRRPPQDRFNALLSFGYALLYRSVLQAVLCVGLKQAIGFYHQPRSAAHPLALDLMELFRVPLCDMPVVGSVNRGQWDVAADFSVTKAKVWLSDSGRKKVIELYERRLQETWKHPVLNYSLSYARTIELEARLLEKEWTGQPGLFARARLR